MQAGIAMKSGATTSTELSDTDAKALLSLQRKVPRKNLGPLKKWRAVRATENKSSKLAHRQCR